MKLFLASYAISKAQAQYLADMAKKPLKGLKIALIENAADVYPLNELAWVSRSRQQLLDFDMHVNQVDLRHYKHKQEGLRLLLASNDVVWFGGGNTFYLRWLLRDIGFEDDIHELVHDKHGPVYAGSSAGSILAGPTLKYFEAADDPNQAPQAIYEGLNLTDTVVVPHMDNPEFSDSITPIRDKLTADGFKVQPLNDNQVLAIHGDKHRLLTD